MRSWRVGYSLLYQSEELLAGLLLCPETPQHARSYRNGTGLLYTTHGHTHVTVTGGTLSRRNINRKHSRGLHHDCDTTGLDCFLNCDCDLFGQPLLNLQTAAECFGNSREFRKPQHELIGNVSYSNLIIVGRGCCGTLDGYSPFL